VPIFSSFNEAKKFKDGNESFLLLSILFELRTRSDRRELKCKLLPERNREHCPRHREDHLQKNMVTIWVPCIHKLNPIKADVMHFDIRKLLLIMKENFTVVTFNYAVFISKTIIFKYLAKV